MLCHGPPCGQFIASRQSARLPRHRVFGMEPSFRALFAPCARRRPGRAAEPCFRAVRAPARPRAFRGGAPDCACAREGEGAGRRSPAGLPVAAKAAGPPAARPGREAPRPVSWNVMSCHGLHAGSLWPSASPVIAAPIRPAPPASRLRHGSLLSSLVRAMRPPPARPCCGTLFSRGSRARPPARVSRRRARLRLRPRARARRSAQVSHRFASSRESRRPASRPAGQGGPRALCHGMSCPVVVSMQAVHSHPPIRPASPASRLRHRSLPSSLVRAIHPAAGPAVQRNPVFARIACAPARVRFAAARPIAPAPARARRRAHVSRRFARGLFSRRRETGTAAAPRGCRYPAFPRLLCHGFAGVKIVT